MTKTRSTLNLLVIAIMIFMIGATAVFIYGSVLFKERITKRMVDQTERLSDMITALAIDLMASGHGQQSYARIMAYSSLIGIDEIDIYSTTGVEAFGPGAAKAKDARRAERDESEAFKKTVATGKASGAFDRAELAYSRYVPLHSRGECTRCHGKHDELIGVLKTRISTSEDFALLDYARKLIWLLGIIAFLPVTALLVAWAVVRDKNRLYRELEESTTSLRGAYNELDETKYYLQMILDNSKVVIVTTDMEGRIVEFNREAEALLGYTKDEVVGKDVLMLYDNPRQRDEMMNDAKTLGDGVWEVRNREVVFRSKTGELFHMTLTLSTMLSDTGEIIGTVGIGKDISEQRMLHFKLMQSEKLAGIGTLASGIAHEINNPLAGILGMAEAIRDEDDMELIKSHTNDIIRYAADASNIVRELSSYSRSAHSTGSSTVEIAEAIEGSLKMARHSSSFSSIELVRDLEEGCLVFANYGELQQVFVNLIINAVYAMGESGRLTVGCSREGEFVEARVTDTGHGIAPGSINQIFDPFFTTKPVGEGTGLGLYVVYRIITKHGGTIDVESRAGEGTTFTLKFPSADPPRAL